MIRSGHAAPSAAYRYEHYDPRMPRFTLPRVAHCESGACTA